MVFSKSDNLAYKYFYAITVNLQLLTKKAYNPTNITVIFQFSNINDKKHLQIRRTCKCLTTLLMFQMCSIVA